MFGMFRNLIPGTTPDLTDAREYFPSLEQVHEGNPVVFFDNPGGTQIAQQVMEAMQDYLLYANSNTHGAFITSQRTDMIIQEARQAMADFLNCAPDEIVFGANMTTLTFAFSRALAKRFSPGDEIVITMLDHDANIAPWRAIARDNNLIIRQIDIHPETGALDMEDAKAKITDKTKLVAFGYASNALGIINDVEALIQLAHNAGALCYVDAVQFAPHGPIDVQKLDCDFLVCSAYKFFGPHVGILFGKKTLLDDIQPYKVAPAGNETPDKFETGTLAHELLAGLLGAIDYLSLVGSTLSNPAADIASAYSGRRRSLKIAMGAIMAYERMLSNYMLTSLSIVRGVTIYGPQNPEDVSDRVPTFAIRVKNKSPRVLSETLAAQGVFAWDGNYYALDLMNRLGLEDSGGALRLGLAHYNTTEEINRCISILQGASA